VNKKLKIWWDSARWVALPNTAMSCILGGLIAFSSGKFDLPRFIIALVGILLVHLGTNLIDDYADLKHAGFHLRDKVRQKEGAGIRTTKAPHIVDGTLKLNHVLYVSLALFAGGLAAGIYLTWVSGWPVAAIAVVGALICFFYSMPPLKLGYRGMGEFSVALTTGPGICLGTYYAVAQSFSWEPVFVGLAIGLMVGIVLYVHSIMDFKPDTAANKRTSIHVIGRTRAIRLLPLILVIAYGVLIAGIILNILHIAILLVLLGAPMAIKLVQIMQQLGRGDYDEVKTKWWMGPMEQNIVGLEWFLVRWKLARNLMITTTLMIIISYGITIII